MVEKASFDESGKFEILKQEYTQKCQGMTLARLRMEREGVFNALMMEGDKKVRLKVADEVIAEKVKEEEKIRLKMENEAVGLSLEKLEEILYGWERELEDLETASRTHEEQELHVKILKEIIAKRKSKLP